MKLRIRQNTLRLRLTRPEVDTLAVYGRVEELTAFSPTATLRYALVIDDASTIGATFDAGCIAVTLPRAVATAWATNQEVSLHGDVPVEGHDALRILVEKDFACLKERPGEDDTHAFPHPKKV
ncbi:hypothetical protein BH09MYX1_BH09MYX1_50650 [soil metagenome]